MTATNHGLSGALIGLAVANPVAAPILAFASHFALDMTPHFGFDRFDNRRRTLIVFAADAFLASSLLVFCFLNSAPLIVFICIFAAISPDFAWLFRFVFYERLGKKTAPKMNAFNKWHAGIQWGERPGRIIHEIIYGSLVGYFVFQHLV